MHWIYNHISSLNDYAPLACVLLFLFANLLIIWRLDSLSKKGVEGTVLGTLFMPFCSGMGNIVFALVLALNNGSGRDVAINCLFNNVTNLTLLIAAPILIWGMTSIGSKKTNTKKKKNKTKKTTKKQQNSDKNKTDRDHEMGRLSLVLNLVAALFFSLFVWLLAEDGSLSRMDGFALLGLFIFWQCFHVYDVKKTNLIQKKNYPKSLPLEVFLLLLSAFAVFISTDWLVNWFQTLDNATLPSSLGWLSGVLMVLPNAMLAFYYGGRDRMDVVYTSQSGDAHICIPLCIGLFAIFRPIPTEPFLQQSLLILIGLCAAHLLLIATTGRLPKVFAAIFIVLFGAFLWLGLF